jgi:hypothetical protein
MTHLQRPQLARRNLIRDALYAAEHQLSGINDHP